MENIILKANNVLEFKGKTYSCAIGAGGILKDKHEGDHATPCGSFPLREVFFRSDRLIRPVCPLPLIELTPDCGWCDDEKSPFYNQYVRLPHPDRHERLWREDHVYDVIMVLGYNDDPVVTGKGSAIFMHIAREGYTPTEGCIALEAEDLLEILEQVDEETHVVVPGPTHEEFSLSMRPDV